MHALTPEFSFLRSQIPLGKGLIPLEKGPIEHILFLQM